MTGTAREFLDRYGEKTVEGLRDRETVASRYGFFGARLRLVFGGLAQALEAREEERGEEGLRLKQLPYGKVEEVVAGVEALRGRRR